MISSLGNENVDHVLLARGCHTHNFCTTIFDRGQNESQQSIRNIHYSQRSSHYIFLIFSIKLVVKVKGNVGAKTGLGEPTFYKSGCIAFVVLNVLILKITCQS